jgi:predicted 3-demethylubiquinone-9 3-methyltransferase (glyoxalase superfamily)
LTKIALGVSISAGVVRRIHGGAVDCGACSPPQRRLTMAIQKITPFLWYSKEAEEAAKFYAGLFPDSRVKRVTTLPTETPSGPAGSVKVVDFELFGQAFTAISAGPLDAFNHAVSFIVNCESQQEIDRYWNAFLEGGGKAEQCGWLKDRYGLFWQIVPTVLGEMMSDPDRAKAKRAADAMLKMVKLDIAALQAAFAGRQA